MIQILVVRPLAATAILFSGDGRKVTLRPAPLVPLTALTLDGTAATALSIDGSAATIFVLEAA